jgi:hypothetical protein
MASLRERFAFDDLRKVTHPRLAQDFVFSPHILGGAPPMTVRHQEVGFLEARLVVTRRVFLESSDGGALDVALALGWNGFADAVAVLFGHAEAFQRELPLDAVVETADALDIGQFGLAWPWSGEGQPDVLGFVRHNVSVFIQASGGTAVAPGRAIDAVLRELATTDDYTPSSEGPLAHALGTEKTRSVSAGRRLDLGRFPASESHFFLADGGSVNRDPDAPEAYYFRAGLEAGPRTITLFSVGDGILPRMETFVVEVTPGQAPGG